MRKSLLALLLLSLAVGPALAVEYEGLTLRVAAQYDMGAPVKDAPAVATVMYSNVTTFSGSGVLNGGAALQGANTITRLTADDLTPIGGGIDVTQFKFSVVNLNAVQLTFRPRARFWFADGAGGAPGTYYNLPAAVGFTFNPVTVGATSATVFTAALGAGVMTMPTSTFWAGLTFDNNSGGTGATAAQLNNLGQGVFGPADVGTSADQYFATTGAGSFFGIANPAGALGNFGGNPVADLGWEFSVDAPISVEPAVWSQVKALYR